jgi:Spy/CpxP family protein refolding chaperone
MYGFHFWRQARRGHCHGEGFAAHPGEFAGGGFEGRFRGRGGWHAAHHHHGDDGGFGVRRPLRFMAYKLELSDEQVEKLAVILNALKTERAQAAVDERRSVNAFADALEAASFDAEKASSAGAERVQTAEKLRRAVEAALRDVHAMLDEDQRKRLAYLMRTGALTI